MDWSCGVLIACKVVLIRHAERACYTSNAIGAAS
jgi:hypothetical protein